MSLVLENRRHVVEIPTEEGFPDGMCIDSEGMLWVACYYGSKVNRYDPRTGEVPQGSVFGPVFSVHFIIMYNGIECK